MIFFFDNLIKEKYNNIISYEEYYNNKKIIICKLIKSFVENINEKFVDIILNDNKNKIIIHNIDSKFNLWNITAFIIYHKVISKKIIKYYILLIGVNPDLRNLGYGKIILDEFVNWIKINEINNITKKIKIILNSIDSSIDFYKIYGFIKTEEKNYKHKLFFKYEPYYINNNYEILELII